MNLPKPKLGYKWQSSIYQQYEEIPEDWDLVSFSETGEIIGGGTPDTTKLEYWENGDIPWFTPEEITNLENNSIKDSNRKITQKGLDQSSAKLIPENNILLSARATIGNCVINEKKCTTNQGFLNLIINRNHNNKFLMYSIQFNKKRLMQYAQGTTFLEISRTNLGKIKIPCPKDIKEEEKISLILSNIDELIQKQHQVIEQNLKLKKGLMQKFFLGKIGLFKTQELPKIKKNHRRNRLGGLCKTATGKFLPAVEQKPGKIPIYGGNGITGLHNQSLITKPVIIIGRVGQYCGSVHFSEKECWITDNAIFLKKIDKELDTKFLFYYLSHLDINYLAEVSAQPKITQKIIEELIIDYSLDIIEQQKIASILSNLDSLIQQEKQYKEKLEKIKRGLMQQLLTGQTRVKV